MSDDHENQEDDSNKFATERSTAPQSAYTGRDVAVGAVIAAVGLAITFGVPLAALL